MRVLAMLHLYPPRHNAGGDITAHILLRELVRRGHQVVVQLSMVHPMHVTGPYTYEGVNVYPYQSPEDPLKWLNLEEKPDIIVSHLMNTLRASILGDIYKIPMISLVHNTHGKTKADLRWKTDLAVYNTEWMKADVENWWSDYQGTPPPRSIVVHPPVFRTDYQVTPPTASKGCVTLINLFEDKGANLFYQLAARFPKLKFLGVTGAYGKQDIRHGLPNVEIIPHVGPGEIKDLVYARTRVLLMPSVYESYGRCGVEAACSRIPTIYHPTPGLLEALGDGGIACDRDDLDAWVVALAGLTTPAGWMAASQKAKVIADRLTPEADLERWVQAAESFARIPAHVI